MRVRYWTPPKPKKPKRGKSQRVKRKKEKQNYSRLESYLSLNWANYDWYYISGSPGPGAYSAQTVATYQMLRQRSYGNNIIDWKRRIAEGLPATTDAENYLPKVEALGFFDWKYRRKGPNPGNPNPYIENLRWQGNYIEAIPGANLFIEPSDDDAAKAKFIKYARKEQSSALSGEFLRDVLKSLNSFNRVRDVFLRATYHFYNPHHKWVRQLKEQILGLEYNSRRDARDALQKRVSENFLEYYYGIAPTIGDLEDISFGIWKSYTRLNQGVPWKRVRGFMISESTTSSQFSISNPTGYNVFNKVKITNASSHLKYVTYYGAVRLLCEDAAAVNMANELGLGYRDFVPTLWEWIPYSFIVDYFTNAGQIISALTFPRSDILWVNRVVRNTTTTTTSYEREIIIPDGATWEEDTFATSPTIHTSKAYSRNLFTDSLVPSLRLHLPYRESAWAAMLALIGQRVRVFK